jgi:hypothetical protein
LEFVTLDMETSEKKPQQESRKQCCAWVGKASRDLKRTLTPAIYP